MPKNWNDPLHEARAARGLDEIAEWKSGAADALDEDDAALLDDVSGDLPCAHVNPAHVKHLNGTMACRDCGTTMCTGCGESEARNFDADPLCICCFAEAEHRTAEQIAAWDAWSPAEGA